MTIPVVAGNCYKFRLGGHLGGEPAGNLKVSVTCGCATLQPDPRVPNAGHGTKNRYISFVPADPCQQTAVRVTFSELPPPFDIYNGETAWVGEPREYCENADQAEPPDGGCGPAPGLASRTFWAATFQCTPSYRDWSVYDTVHVYHESVVPGGVYEFQAIDQACDTGVEASYSAPLSVETSAWGDIVKDCTTNPCGPPDGVINVPTDATAIVDKFRNLPGAPIKARCDLAGTPPNDGALDFKITVLDVIWCLDAFIGAEYPFPPEPNPCP